MTQKLPFRFDPSPRTYARAAAMPLVAVADPAANARVIIERAAAAEAESADLLVS